MNDLIKTHENENGELEVSGRELHEFLEVGTPYDKWFHRMAEYGFSEGTDFNLDKNVRVQKEGNREVSRNIIDHHMTITMAKELCMLQRTDKGKQARQYFLKLEQAWNTPEMVMARALKFADKAIEQKDNVIKLQEQIIGELKPLADYTDVILKNKGLVTITQIAKDYGMSGKELNNILHKKRVQYKLGDQWLLYAKYQKCGYTHSETVNFKHRDGRSDVRMNTKWTQKGRLFIYDLLKECHIFPLIELEILKEG